MRAFPVLPPIRRSAASAPLDIRASVGTSTSPTSTGTKAVTGVGFQPKVVLPFAVDIDAVGTGTSARLGLGAGLSSSNRASIGVYSNNGVTTSATNRNHQNTRINLTHSGPVTVNQEADLTSLDADGFTLNWSTVAASARILNHICLGGADLEVSLTQQQMNGTNAAQSFAHGLSGAPTGVLFLSSIQGVVPPATAAAMWMTIGAWAGANQFSALSYSRTGVTTTLTNRALLTNAVLGSVVNGTTTLDRTMAVSTVDATNVNVTYPVTVGAGQIYFWMLCVRGAKCQVGTFDCNGSTSPLTIATTGITPKLFLPVFVPGGVDSVGTVLSDLLLSIGASDGTNNVSCGISDANGVTTTNARRFQSSTSLCEYSTGGTKSFEGTAAFSGESVVLTPTTNASTTYGQGGWLCIGI